MAAKTKVYLSLESMLGRDDIPVEVALELNEIAARLVQIQIERKGLDEEEGYKDSQGVRHPGIKDRFQELLEALPQGVIDGVRTGEFNVYKIRGTAVWLEKVLLLNAGVLPDQIEAGTCREDWTGVSVREASKPESELESGRGRGRGRGRG